MPYPTRLLNAGEEIALDLRPHWWYFSKHILTGVPVLILLVLAFSVDNTILWWFWAIVALIWAGWLGLQYLNWTFTHFVGTNSRVIFRTGVLANGLTYYVKANKKPEKRVQLWLAVNSGSVLETDEQRGGSSDQQREWQRRARRPRDSGTFEVVLRPARPLRP